MPYKGQDKRKTSPALRSKNADKNDFVLEQHIFSNVFEKDIKRVFIYKKSERLAKAIHLVAPAFREAPSLRDRIDKVAVSLVDASITPTAKARETLSRELLALSSILSIARTGEMLSEMNAEIISKEAQDLLLEIASYEEPRVFLDNVPSLAELSREAEKAQANAKTDESNKWLNRGLVSKSLTRSPSSFVKKTGVSSKRNPKGHKGQVKDTVEKTSRRDAIVSVVRAKGSAYIKDVSTVIRNVSEKTVQRELASLVNDGVLVRTGSRRWTSYSLA